MQKKKKKGKGMKYKLNQWRSQELFMGGGGVQQIYIYLILSLLFSLLFVLISVFLSLVDISFFDSGKKKK
jgi:hypothetical protein